MGCLKTSRTYVCLTNEVLCRALFCFCTKPSSALVRGIWQFSKIGDPNIAPQLVGSLLEGPQNKVPLIFGNCYHELEVDVASSDLG